MGRSIAEEDVRKKVAILKDLAPEELKKSVRSLSKRMRERVLKTIDEMKAGTDISSPTRVQTPFGLMPEPSVPQPMALPPTSEHILPILSSPTSDAQKKPAPRRKPRRCISAVCSQARVPALLENLKHHMPKVIGALFAFATTTLRRQRAETRRLRREIDEVTRCTRQMINERQWYEDCNKQWRQEIARLECDEEMCLFNLGR